MRNVVDYLDHDLSDLSEELYDPDRHLSGACDLTDVRKLPELELWRARTWYRSPLLVGMTRSILADY